MNDAGEKSITAGRVRGCRIGCDRLAIAFGMLAWVSFGTTYTFDFDKHLRIALAFGYGAFLLTNLGILALIVSSIWERRWGLHFFSAGFLILPLAAIYAVGLFVTVYWGGV